MAKGVMTGAEATVPSLSRALLRHARAITAGVQPDAVRRKAALCILDHLACCLPLRGHAWTASVLRYAATRPAAPEAHHFWHDRKLTAGDADFGNALLGHWLIRDDMHVPSASHLGVVVVPAMLALAEREGLSGRALLAGIVAGYEGMARAGMAIRSGAFNPHFRATGIAGAYGATVGAAVALGLDEDVAVNALGLAANFAAGVNEWSWSGGQEPYIHAGTAARNALHSIDLAKAGIVASERILEGRDGMFAAYHASYAAAAILLHGIGIAPPAITQVAHKPFAGCNYILTPVAAALALRRRDALRPDDIAAVSIRTFTAACAYPGCDSTGPFASNVAAKMSLQYGVAAALLWGTEDETIFSRYTDIAVQALTRRCILEIVPGFDAAYPGRQPAEIVVTLRDGTVRALGLPDVPWLSDDAVIVRFEAEAHPVIGLARHIVDGVLALDATNDCRPLFESLHKATASPRAA